MWLINFKTPSRTRDTREVREKSSERKMPKVDRSSIQKECAIAKKSVAGQKKSPTNNLHKILGKLYIEDFKVNKILPDEREKARIVGRVASLKAEKSSLKFYQFIRNTKIKAEIGDLEKKKLNIDKRLKRNIIKAKRAGKIISSRKPGLKIIQETHKVLGISPKESEKIQKDSKRVAQAKLLAPAMEFHENLRNTVDGYKYALSQKFLKPLNQRKRELSDDLRSNQRKLKKIPWYFRFSREARSLKNTNKHLNEELEKTENKIGNVRDNIEKTSVLGAQVFEASCKALDRIEGNRFLLPSNLKTGLLSRDANMEAPPCSLESKRFELRKIEYIEDKKINLVLEQDRITRELKKENLISKIWFTATLRGRHFYRLHERLDKIVLERNAVEKELNRNLNILAAAHRKLELSSGQNPSGTDLYGLKNSYSSSIRQFKRFLPDLLYLNNAEEKIEESKMALLGPLMDLRARVRDGFVITTHDYKEMSITPLEKEKQQLCAHRESLEENLRKMGFFERWFSRGRDLRKDYKITGKHIEEVDEKIALHKLNIENVNVETCRILKEVSEATSQVKSVDFLKDIYGGTTSKGLYLRFPDGFSIAKYVRNPWRVTLNSEGSFMSSRRPHWPGRNSGLTIGPGYDIGVKDDSRTVLRDLSQLGLSKSDIEVLLPAVGYRGAEAEKYFLDNQEVLSKVALSYNQWMALFKRTYKSQTALARVVWNREVNKIPFEELPPGLQALVVDCKYRGDFWKSKRDSLFPAVIKAAEEGDFSAVHEVMLSKKWSDVPRGRRRARIQLIKTLELITGSEKV